jgi:hypothetical protein
MTTAHMLAPPRRYLVLSDEAARHPFRASLPPHVRMPLEETPEPARNWRITRRDWRQFIATYSAAFIVVTAFIS